MDLRRKPDEKLQKKRFAGFNNGRKKTFFCLAVNLLDLPDIEYAVAQIKKRITDEGTLLEKAAVAVECFEAVAKKGHRTETVKEAVKSKIRSSRVIE